jgi:hypothetical protein
MVQVQETLFTYLESTESQPLVLLYDAGQGTHLFLSFRL